MFSLSDSFYVSLLVCLCQSACIFICILLVSVSVRLCVCLRSANVCLCLLAYTCVYLSVLSRQNYFGDAWNVFDFIIVLGSVIDIVYTEVNVSTLRSS